jgi:hypothetical protein
MGLAVPSQTVIAPHTIQRLTKAAAQIKGFGQ